MSQTQQIPLTPLESRSTSLHTLDDSERALDADVPSPPPGTRVVEALDSYPDGGEQRRHCLTPSC